jgi:acyl carrier protein
MIGSQDAALKLRLKKMILEECERDELQAEDIDDQVLLFSPESGLGLDSVDAQQISMSLQVTFNVRLVDPKAFRRVVTSINGLADYLQPE